LVKEAIKPGKYSKRTLDYLKSFDINDCKLFKKLTQFIFTDEEIYSVPCNSREKGVRYITTDKLLP